jgi:hypothetical protein
MIINPNPIRSDATLALHRAGDVLSVNGLAFDFGGLPEGAILPPGAVGCDWLSGPVTREGGILRLAVLLPHGADAPQDALFPAPVSPPDGPVALPGHPGAPEAATAAGAIDWGQMITAEASETAARADWRATCEISKLQLVLAMAQTGMVSPASAIAAAAGGIPAEFEGVVAAMPAAAQNEARIRWAGAATIPRLSPLILAVQAATGLPDETLDVLFGWGA